MTTTNTTAAQVEALSSYEQQAIDFLNSTNTKFKAVYLKHDFYFLGDKQRRDIYRITLIRTGKRYSLTFGQSIAGAGKTPTPYDVLACLQKYDVGTFEDFCGEFGYDEDSRNAEKIYKAVCKEWANIQNLCFSFPYLLIYCFLLLIHLSFFLPILSLFLLPKLRTLLIHKFLYHLHL